MSDETNKHGHNDTTSPSAATETAENTATETANPQTPPEGADASALQGSGDATGAAEASAAASKADGDAPGPGAGASDDETFGFAAELQAQVRELERQQSELVQRLAAAQSDIHRYQAEIQNLHRRREREAEEAGKYAIAKFAKDTVEVADNFERAISSVPADSVAENPVLKSLLDGVTMTERAFLNVLERHGVKRLSPQDEPFDPHKHQAVMEREDRSVPAGTVLQVFQAGYMIADRVLRPAMVVVARGGPKPVKQPAEAAADSGAAGLAGGPDRSGDAAGSSGVGGGPRDAADTGGPGTGNGPRDDETQTGGGQ